MRYPVKVSSGDHPRALPPHSNHDDPIHSPNRHITGLVARMAMAMQYPPVLTDRGVSTYSAEEYALAVLSFGFGGFVSGFALISSSKDSVDGKLYPIQMSFPTPQIWRFNHQLLLSISIACYGLAHALFTYDSGGNKNFVSTNAVFDISASQNVYFVSAWFLNIFASGLLNGLLCNAHAIILRAGNMDGHVLDAFMGFADCLVSRSLRMIWRVKLQCLAIVSFFLGCMAGSAVFMSAFGPYALCFGCIALAPLWVMGASMLVQGRMKSAARVVRQSNLGEEYMDEFVNVEQEISEDFSLDVSTTNRLASLDVSTTNSISLPLTFPSEQSATEAQTTMDFHLRDAAASRS